MVDVALSQVERRIDVVNDSNQNMCQVTVADCPYVRLVPTPQEETWEHNV